MGPRTEEFLYMLLWGAERLSAPTFRNLTESYEQWAYRRGILFHLEDLEHRALIEKKSDATAECIYRLTEEGRLAALGGRDPEERWNRSWDGCWRVVVFDVPQEHNAARVRLRRLLRHRQFGCLQKSLWITPDPFDDCIKELAAVGDDVETFLTLEAKPCSAEENQAMVTGAWNFDRINRLYEAYLELLQGAPPPEARDLADLRRWAHEERVAWQEAVDADPLLPDILLPQGYLGQEAWAHRNRALREAGRALD